MRVSHPLSLVALVLLFGCATGSDIKFKPGTGDVGQFILQQAIAHGAMPVTTNGLPAISGEWRYDQDRFGVVIHLPDNDCGMVEDLLRQAFGKPQFGPITNNDGGTLLEYHLAPGGGRIQFCCGVLEKDTQVAIIRPLTDVEYARAVAKWNRAAPKSGAP